MSQRNEALQIFEAALAAVDPYESVRRVLSRESGELTLQQAGTELRFDLDGIDRLHVVGCGKAGAPMARAVEELVGDRISSGLVVVKYGHTLPEETQPAHIRIAEAGHPEPDAAGMTQANEVVEILKGASEKDLVVALMSGGGSCTLAPTRLAHHPGGESRAHAAVAGLRGQHPRDQRGAKARFPNQGGSGGPSGPSGSGAGPLYLGCHW